jgi:lysozyme
MTLIELVEELLLKHEGYKEYPYKDTKGKLTVGIGRNITDRPITPKEVSYLIVKNKITQSEGNNINVENRVSLHAAKALLEEDVKSLINKMNVSVPCFKNLDMVRQAVLIDMAYNMGMGGLLEFKRTLAAVKDGNYKDAAKDMLESQWSLQVKERATELAKMMKTGEV